MQRRRLLRVAILLLFDVVIVYVAFPYFAASDLRKGLMEADPVRLRRWIDEPRLLRALQEQFPQSAVTLTPFVVRSVIADGVPNENSVTPITLGNLHRAFFDSLTTFRVVYNQQNLVFELRGFWWRLTDISMSNLPANARLSEPDAAVVMPTDVPTSEELGFTTLVARVLTPPVTAPTPVAAAPPQAEPASAAPTLTGEMATRICARMAEAEQKVRAFARQHARELAQLYPGSLEVVRNRRRLAEYEQSLRDDYRAKVAREFGIGEVDVELALLAGATNTPPARP